MIFEQAPSQPDRRPFWQELVLAAVAGAVVPLAHHAGKALRETLAARRRSRVANTS